MQYTPAANFFGTDTFTYTMSDGNGGNDSATVTVEVSNVNDNPTANADSYTGILEDSTDNQLDVLANDSIAPDVEETLTIVSVGSNAAGDNGQTAQGGTVTISAGKVLYTPKANFFGTDTFSYTISDGNGGTSKATVTIVVNDVNDNPTAVNDQLMALKDFANQELDVLPNDFDRAGHQRDSDHHRARPVQRVDDRHAARHGHDFGGRQEDHLHARSGI